MSDIAMGGLSEQADVMNEREARTNPLHALRRLGSSAGWWGVLAAVTVLAAGAMHVMFALTAKTPAFPFDELTLLQYAKYLSGTGISALVGGAGYFPGLSFVLAPIWWATSDPATFYHLAIWIGVAMALATIWPLSLLVKRFGLSTPQSIAVAGLVMCMPSRAVQSAYTMSEKLLFLVLACAAVAACRVWEKTTFPRAAVLALLVGLAVLTHVRAMTLLFVTVVWLLLLMRRNWRVATAGATATTVLGAAAYEYSMWLNQHLLDQRFNQGTGLLGNLRSGPAIIARAFFGQAWYQIVSSLGIVIIGIIALISFLIRQWRERHGFGSAAWLLGAFVAASMLSILDLSSEDAMFMSGRGRLDMSIYGRYNDPFSALVIAVGLAAIITGFCRRKLLLCAAIGLAIMIPTVYWVAPNAYTWGMVTPAHIPGILPWGSTLPFAQSLDPSWMPTTSQSYSTWSWMVPTLTNQNRFWLIASLSVVAFWITLFVARRHVKTLIALLTAASCIGGALSLPMVVTYQLKDGGKPAVVTAIETIEAKYGETTVYFDHQCTPNPGNSGWAQNEFAFWLGVRDFHITNSYADLGNGLMISCAGEGIMPSWNAVQVGNASSIGYQLWVLPGALQTTLRLAGMTVGKAQ